MNNARIVHDICRTVRDDARRADFGYVDARNVDTRNVDARCAGFGRVDARRADVRPERRGWECFDLRDEFLR